MAAHRNVPIYPHSCIFMHIYAWIIFFFTSHCLSLHEDVQKHEGWKVKAQVTYIILIILSILIRLALAASLVKFDSCLRSQFILSFVFVFSIQVNSVQLKFPFAATCCVVCDHTLAEEAQATKQKSITVYSRCRRPHSVYTEERNTEITNILFTTHQCAVYRFFFSNRAYINKYNISTKGRRKQKINAPKQSILVLFLIKKIFSHWFFFIILNSDILLLSHQFINVKGMCV